MRKHVQKKRAIIAVVGKPGPAKSGAAIEWLLAAEAEMVSAGEGPLALVIAVTAIELLAKEAFAIPTSAKVHDRHTRQWMLKLAVHQAAIQLGRPYPSVVMHYLIEKIIDWKATLAEAARQLLKNNALPFDDDLNDTPSKSARRASSSS